MRGERTALLLSAFHGRKRDQPTNQVFESGTLGLGIAHRTGRRGTSVVVSCHSTYISPYWLRDTDVLV
jgi:hypothetical protein